MNIHIDHSRFPLVWMDYRSVSGQDDLFSQLDRLLQREQPFVLVTADDPGEAPKNGEEQSGLKEAALWMKQNKEAIRRWIKASIVITPDPEAQARVAAFAETYQKFWGYPLLHCATTQEATAMVDELLSAEPGNRP